MGQAAAWDGAGRWPWAPAETPPGAAAGPRNLLPPEWHEDRAAPHFGTQQLSYFVLPLTQRPPSHYSKYQNTTKATEESTWNTSGLQTNPFISLHFFPQRFWLHSLIIKKILRETHLKCLVLHVYRTCFLKIQRSVQFFVLLYWLEWSFKTAVQLFKLKKPHSDGN